MSIRDRLIDSTRALILAITDATDEKVIRAPTAGDARGPRPALPYLTVRMLTPGGESLGLAERLHGLNGSTPTEAMSQRRQATMSIQGYGSTSYEWLDQLGSLIDSSDSLDVQAAEGFSFRLQNELTQLDALLGTSSEFRCTLDLLLTYRRISDPRDRIAIERIEVDLELGRFDGDPDTLDLSIVLDGDGNPIP